MLLFNAVLIEKSVWKERCIRACEIKQGMKVCV